MSRPAGQFDARKQLVLGYLKKFPNGTASVRDVDIAEHAHQSVRHVQRILSALRKEGAIEVSGDRYKHPSLGWCNKRTIHVKG